MSTLTLGKTGRLRLKLHRLKAPNDSQLAKEIGVAKEVLVKACDGEPIEQIAFDKVVNFIAPK